jgi:predicted ribosome quality control (RQC) complex YloA/Tae2 family protein
MTRLSEGNITRVAISKIRQPSVLTAQEQQWAEALAPLIQNAQRTIISTIGTDNEIEKPFNWVLVYVKELKKDDYELVGSPVVLAACKLAGLKSVYCLQLDHSEEATQQVLRSQQQQEPLTEKSGIDSEILRKRKKQLEAKIEKLDRAVSDFDKTIEALKKKQGTLREELQTLNQSFADFIQYVLPPESININTDSEAQLVACLQMVKGIDTTAGGIAQEIIQKRPFASEDELARKVKLFWATSSKKPSFRFENLKKTLEIHF